MELALLNRSSDPVVAAELPWIGRAVNLQLSEHFLPAYENFFLRIRQTAEHWPVAAYANTDGLNPSEFDPLFIMDAVPAGELGSHSNVGGIVTARALAQGRDTSTTVSHEAIEHRADRPAAIWIRQPDGSALAFEPCDACESSDYPIDIELLSMKRSIQVSNFVLPSWFLPGSEGPWDYLALLDGPGKLLNGCHAVRMEIDGEITTETRRAAAMAMQERLANPAARTARRIASGAQALILDAAELR